KQADHHGGHDAKPYASGEAPQPSVEIHGCQPSRIARRYAFMSPDFAFSTILLAKAKPDLPSALRSALPSATDALRAASACAWRGRSCTRCWRKNSLASIADLLSDRCVVSALLADLHRSSRTRKTSWGLAREPSPVDHPAPDSKRRRLLSIANLSACSGTICA